MNFREIINQFIKADDFSFISIEFIEDYLIENDFEGLCSDECACELDDLLPFAECHDNFQHCRPGYKIPCPEDCEFHNEGCEWHIVEVKPRKEVYRGKEDV